MEEIHQEMQLLSFTPATVPPSLPPQYSPHPQRLPWPRAHFETFHGPSLDLQLSISLTPSPSNNNNNNNNNNNSVVNFENYEIETLKWEAAEEIRLATVEKAYADRMMEMARKEMETARSEFMRARSLWDRAREEVERAEKMKDRAFRASKDSVCMEVTCLRCSQKFRPY